MSLPLSLSLQGLLLQGRPEAMACLLLLRLLARALGRCHLQLQAPPADLAMAAQERMRLCHWHLAQAVEFAVPSSLGWQPQGSLLQHRAVSPQHHHHAHHWEQR